MIRHHCHLAVKPASTPWRLLSKQTCRDSLPIDMLVTAVCLCCCAVKFGNPEGTYELPCICMRKHAIEITRLVVA
jgi:hypothetical protein